MCAGLNVAFLSKSVLRGRSCNVDSNSFDQEISGPLNNPQLCYCVQNFPAFVLCSQRILCVELTL